MIERIIDFAYKYDFWDFSSVADEIGIDSMIDELRKQLASDPGSIAEYLEQFNSEDAEKLASEIRRTA